MPLLRPAETISPTLLKMYGAHFLLSDEESHKSLQTRGYVHIVFPNAYAAVNWADATGMSGVARFRDLNHALTDKATLIVACCTDDVFELGAQFLRDAGTWPEANCEPGVFISAISIKYPGGWSKFIDDTQAWGLSQ